jgi:energy-coupling factor transporter ATP-binding protein EcfA2
MQMTIRAIIVWPKRRDKQYRQVVFQEGAINVVTGTSGSGKSSLIHIVDYCLGSGKCSIPVGIIRDTVEWFGVLLQLESTQLLAARKNPEDKDQTGDVYLMEAPSIDMSAAVPEKNANVEYLKQRLNELAGLPNIGFDPSSTSGFKGPPSFRDLVAFLFQPQHIVANPNTVFFKADTYEHREKLRTIFPLVLGAVTPEQLAAKHELFQLQAQLEQRQAMLDRQRAAVDASIGQLRAYALRAQELGLLPSTITIEQDTDTQRLLDTLRAVPRRLADGVQPIVAIDAAEPVVQQIRVLEEREDTLARDLSRVQRRRLQIERLRASVGTYGEQLVSQEGRLTGIGWLAKRISGDDECPFCGSESDTAKNAIAQLQALAEEMQRLSATTSRVSPTLDRELGRLVEEARGLETQLRGVREEKWYLEDQSVELADRRRTEVEAFRLAGRVDQVLELHDKVSIDSDLTQSIADLSERIAALRETANHAVEKARLSGALQRFTQSASRYVDVLQLERGSDPVELNVDDLMIRVVRATGRSDALWEIGSAENWMGYHLATLLSLHEVFLRLPASPVPTFLVIDQPSQAYFPDRWPGDLPQADDTTSIDEQSEDIAGVRRIFQTLAVAVSRSEGKLQLIVTDHAGEITWTGVPSVNVVGNWRKGRDDYLIPQDWFEGEGQ